MVDYLRGVAVVDIEATSLDTAKGAIASIGMVTFRHGSLVRFYRVFRPFSGARIDPESMAVNGFTLGQLCGGRDCDCGEWECKVPGHALGPEKAPECMAEFMHANGCHTLAGQNPAFDTGYINAYFERYRKFNFLSHRTVDLHSIAYARLAGRNAKVPTEVVKDKNGTAYFRNNLSATRIYALLGMPAEPKPHNALTGAVFEFEALCRLVYGKRVLEEFRKYGLGKDAP